MLKQRVITAICLIALFLFSLLWLPSIWFSIFVAVFLLVAAWEWAGLSNLSGVYQKLIYCSVGVLLAAALGFYLGFFGRDQLESEKVLPVFIAAATWWAVALLWVQGYPSSAVLWGNRWVRALMGFWVLVPSALALVFLQQQPQSVGLILMIVAIVATADIGAYFFGRAFGQRKLAKEVSPGKSWEGVLGGLLACTLLAVGIAVVVDIDMSFILLAIILPTALVSVLGDLLESMVKRHCGVKDSGTILPGHGGVLDRLDGFTAALPIFVLAIILSGWQLPL
jgi:phosphatidate cytidylyltransferase